MLIFLETASQTNLALDVAGIFDFDFDLSFNVRIAYRFTKKAQYILKAIFRPLEILL